jgi:hypothetical protein
MRWRRIPFVRARTRRLSLLAGVLVVTANLATGTPVHAANDLQGTITVAGEGSGNLTNCNPCTLTVATTGYVTGLDGMTPFTLAWGTPGIAPMPASLSVVMTASCQGTPAIVPGINVGPTATFTINGAVFVDGETTQITSVTGQINAFPETTSTWLVGGLGLTVQTSNGPVTISIRFAEGEISVVPASDFLCDPQPTEPTTYALSGTLMSIA